MRRKHRGIFAILAALLVVAVTGIAWTAWAWRLPDPTVANREQLSRWLVLRELSEQPPETQLTLVDRLINELSADADMTGQAGELSSPYYERLIRNVELLKRVWFHDRVNRYHACETNQRMIFLEEQIETIMIWATVDLGPPDDAMPFDAQTQRHIFTMQFFDDVENWITEAEPLAAARMNTAVQDGLTCWLATRSLQDEPMATRRDLASRIIIELDRGLRLDEIVVDLLPDQRQTLRDNGWLLLEAWLHNEADEYAKLPLAERSVYVDGQIDRFMGWGFVGLFTSDSPETPSATASETLVRLMLNVEQWVQQADPEQQVKLRPLVDQVQQRMMLRSLQGVFGGSS